jgi:hypothetical protein
VLASVRDEGVAVDALPAADVAVLDPGGKVPETPKDGLLFGDGAAKPAPAPSQSPPAGQGRDLFPEAATK